jgi:hypothetical protein
VVITTTATLSPLVSLHFSEIMSLPTTPYSLEGTTSRKTSFAAAVHALCQGEALAHWAPPAPFVVTPKCLDDMIVPEVVIGVGTVNNNRRFFYFESLYDEFLARGGDEVDVLKSFIKALAFRRCRSVELTSLTSILNKIFRNPLLDLEDWEDLAGIVSDMNSEALVNEFIERSRMATRQHRPCYYSHLMRFAAEQLEAPCFGLVMAVVDAINATGATWTEATMYHLLGAFCRIKDNMPYETILHLVAAWRDARLREDEERPTHSNDTRESSKSPVSINVKGEHVSDSPFPTSMMSRVLSLCERALGADVGHAKAIMDLMGNRESWDRCISVVGASYEFERPPLHEPWAFYLIDPLTIDVKLLGEPLPSSHYVFMFSALRALCEKAQLHGEAHYMHSAKLQPIRDLFRTFPTRIVVLPPEIELALRVGGIDECEAVPTPAYFSHICPRCVMSTVPAHSYCVGVDVHQQAHDCGLPHVLPSNGGVSLLAYFVKCSMNLHCQPGRSLMVVTTNTQVIKELMPLTLRFSSSWFSICDQIVVQGR